MRDGITEYHEIMPVRRPQGLRRWDCGVDCSIVMDKARQVQEMFDGIADRYDLANDVLSFGMHRIWERRLVNKVPADLEGCVLDLCSGTGALLPLLSSKFAKIIAADFSAKMLSVSKVRNSKLANIEFAQEDALNLTFKENSVKAVVISYGVRNFADLPKGLAEAYRVLEPAGTLAILEFGQPEGIFGSIFKFYSRFILPLLGAIITGDSGAYKYLHQTAAVFPCGDKFKDILRQSGFRDIELTKLFSGLCYIYTAKK